MPKMELKQGQQVRVKDGYLNMPYHKLWLHANGKMDTDYLRGGYHGTDLLTVECRQEIKLRRLSFALTTSDNKPALVAYRV